MLFYVISEITSIRDTLMATKIGLSKQDDAYWIQQIDKSEMYWLLFVIISILYILFMFTAIYIGLLITKSLHFMSSLSTKTLKMQYATSIIVTFLMQIQFVILLLVYNIWDKPEDGFCAAIPFFMILVYSEFIIVCVCNHFSFSNQDFVLFGREAIKKNEVQLFDFLPDYDSIHDLHNYRRIYGEGFLWNVDHSAPYLSASDIDDVSSEDEREEREEQKSVRLRINKKKKKQSSIHLNKRKSLKNNKKDVIEEEEREQMRNIKHSGVDSLSLSIEENDDVHLRTTTATTNTTNKETGHHHPETTTSLSLVDIDAHYDTNNTSNSSFSSSDDQNDGASSPHKSKKGKTRRKRRNLSEVP